MSNPFTRALRGAHQSLKRVAGVSITYYRPSVGNVTLTAVPGDTEHQIERDGNMVEQFKTRDFIINVQDLVISSEILPEIGDYIIEDESGFRFDILKTSGEAQWVYTDQTRALIRVHTRRG